MVSLGAMMGHMFAYIYSSVLNSELLALLLVFAHSSSILYNPVEEDSITLLHGEDFHIRLPSLNAEVTFLNKSTPRSDKMVLFQGGRVVSSRAKINNFLSHLIIEAVGEGDEGFYTIKDPDKPQDAQMVELIVRGRLLVDDPTSANSNLKMRPTHEYIRLVSPYYIVSNAN